jgi:hypothetical protein
LFLVLKKLRDVPFIRHWRVLRLTRGLIGVVGKRPLRPHILFIRHSRVLPPRGAFPWLKAGDVTAAATATMHNLISTVDMRMICPLTQQCLVRADSTPRCPWRAKGYFEVGSLGPAEIEPRVMSLGTGVSSGGEWILGRTRSDKGGAIEGSLGLIEGSLGLCEGAPPRPRPWSVPLA